MDRKLLALLSVFFISFAMFAALVVFEEPLSNLISAREDSIPSSDHTLLFAWPLKAKADGTQVSTVTVFVRNSNGRPLSNKAVGLTASTGRLQQPTATTDKEGKAVFILTSTQPGIAELNATVENVYPVTQNVSVMFE